jgi:hypothetical protein
MLLFMLVDIHAKYLAVSGDVGHHEFHTDKGNPGHFLYLPAYNNRSSVEKRHVP